ncbi:Unknown protein [Striga hermonthica]|uniref:BED-type domain-containing protein n=1 Tax=Striga hermonthica TaxID=68872 RepID=A0A9N7RIB6_STRHE|nr:Unknown protein [Striga hermonthica]
MMKVRAADCQESYQCFIPRPILGLHMEIGPRPIGDVDSPSGSRHVLSSRVLILIFCTQLVTGAPSLLHRQFALNRPNQIIPQFLRLKQNSRCYSAAWPASHPPLLLKPLLLYRCSSSRCSSSPDYHSIIQMSSQEEMDGSNGPVDNASNETPTQPTEDTSEVKGGARQRKMQSRSKTWTHFTRILDKNENVIGAKCNHCKKEYACHTKRNGTSSLLAHMTSCMKNSENVDVNQSLLNVQPGKDGVVGSSSITAWKYNYGEIRKSLAYMICSDELIF